MKVENRWGSSLLKPIELEAIDGNKYDSAFLTLVRLVQQQAHLGLAEALERFPKHEAFSRRLALAELLPPITHYSPFVVDGVIRVVGRLKKANVSMNFYHPIILLRRHYATGLIIALRFLQLIHTNGLAISAPDVLGISCARGFPQRSMAIQSSIISGLCV